mmetsp:Transcript_2887/g.4950  ORF Transcript_2887/g.4950 Transcript_2887/m.4950 type:complete len:201 (-) Transcript_2887:933-1535(-)
MNSTSGSAHCRAAIARMTRLPSCWMWCWTIFGALDPVSRRTTPTWPRKPLTARAPMRSSAHALNATRARCGKRRLIRLPLVLGCGQVSVPRSKHCWHAWLSWCRQLLATSQPRRPSPRGEWVTSTLQTRRRAATSAGLPSTGAQLVTTRDSDPGILRPPRGRKTSPSWWTCREAWGRRIDISWLSRQPKQSWTRLTGRTM